MNCDDPKKLLSRNIRISKHAESPGDPTFAPNKTYYLIGKQQYFLPLIQWLWGNVFDTNFIDKKLS